MSGFTEIDKTLWQALNDNSGLSDLLGQYDNNNPAIFRGLGPEGYQAPYINFFNIATTPDDTHSSLGEKVIYQINAHAKTLLVCQDIMTAINQALHWVNYSVTGYTTIAFQRISGPNSLPQEDNIFVSQTANYQVTVQQVAE